MQERRVGGDAPHSGDAFALTDEREVDMANELMARQNEIVIYQPDDTLRLDVALSNDTVWLNQQQMGELFGRERSVIAKHIRNAFREGELSQKSVCAKFAQTAADGKTYQVDFYNLDVIISVGYRVKSIRGTQFRQWATRVLRDYMLKGLAYNTRMNQFEDKIDRRMVMQEGRIAALEKQVDYIVRTALPAPEQVFVSGQFLDAHVELLSISCRMKGAIPKTPIRGRSISRSRVSCSPTFGRSWESEICGGVNSHFCLKPRMGRRWRNRGR